MADCYKCDKTLGIFEGYRHPTLGQKYLLCNNCFDDVSESVRKWGEFVVSNSFNKNTSSNGLEIDLKKIFTMFNRKHENYQSYVKATIGKNTQLLR